MKIPTLLIAILILLAACTQAEDPLPAPTTAVIVEAQATIEVEPTQPATHTPEIEPQPVDPITTPKPSIVEAAPTETAVPAIAPIAVTYFTPAQQEGPYYTVNKPEDRDNDLATFAGAAGVPIGQILEFGGTVYGADGLPLEGITLEIWQTDANGVYLHPNDPGTNGRDPNFQFYGEAVTDAAGSYNFRTVLPGLYEPRPRHIHVKIKLADQELLTTQFYFSGEVNLQGDDAALIIAAEPAQDEAGNPILKGQRDIILNFTPNN